jgi:hypothetical protein
LAYRIIVCSLQGSQCPISGQSAQVDDDFAFALGKFALTPFADCLGD